MIWRMLVASTIALVVISFSFVFSLGISEPSLFSLPFILWTGILSTGLLVVFTFLGSRFFPSNKE